MESQITKVIIESDSLKKINKLIEEKLLRPKIFKFISENSSNPLDIHTNSMKYPIIKVHYGKEYETMKRVRIYYDDKQNSYHYIVNKDGTPIPNDVVIKPPSRKPTNPLILAVLK